MSVECFPITVLPHMSRIYLDYLAMGDSAGDAAVRRWYGAEPFVGKWLKAAAPVKRADGLADLLERQAAEFGASDAAKDQVLVGRGAKLDVADLNAGEFAQDHLW